MSAFAVLELRGFPRRVALMAAAAATAAIVDIASKELVVALEPSTLVYGDELRGAFGIDTHLIWPAIAASLVACAIPARLVAAGAGVALGGALGNLSSHERWWPTHGGTPDFIPFGDGSTGNLADVMIAVGAGTMLLSAVGWLLLSLARYASSSSSTRSGRR